MTMLDEEEDNRFMYKSGDLHLVDGAANDCVAMDRNSVRSKDEDGHLRVALSHISKACVNPYYGKEIPDSESLGLDPEKVYQLFRDPEELRKGAATFVGKPLLLRHTPSFAADHPRDDVVGSVGDKVEFNDPYLDAPLTVWDGAMIEEIENERQHELSSSYRYDADMTSGTYKGQRYDGVMRNIRGNHVAIVKDGRAGTDVVVGDSLPNGMKVNWNVGQFDEKKNGPKKETKQANDSKEKTMTKHTNPVLSRHAAITQGALMVYLGPKLAKDSSIDLRAILKGTTARNFKTVRPTLVIDLKKATAGKLAKDASLDDLNLLLDKLSPSDEAMDEEEPPKSAKKNEDDDAEELNDISFDDGREEELRSILEGKCQPEEIDRVLELMRSGDGDAKDEMADDLPEAATDEDEDAEKEKMKMKGMVNKTAMDAALRKNRDETIAEMKRQFADRTEAQNLVRPIIGEVTIAMDTAEKIYVAALDHSGVKHKGVHPSALRPMVELVVNQLKARPANRQPLAADSGNALTEFAKKHNIDRLSV
jgi:hypothetical protein